MMNNMNNMMNNMNNINMMNNLIPIGINNLGMNPMGMNNQPNLMNGIPMDETAQNIKSIIQPYENKIRELEEIIKQKDFEITVLKQKLKNTNSNENFMNINQMNLMNMNMNQNPMNQMNMDINQNQMNMMINNIDQLMNDKGQEIILKVKKENELIDVKCFEGDLPKIFKTKNIGRGAFTYKYKPLKSNLTLKDNGLTNNSIINFKKSMMNVVFKDNKGFTQSVVLTYDCPLGIALTYYIIEYEDLSYLMSMINNEDKIIFLYDAVKLKIKDKTPIGQVFKNTPLSCVTVTFK